MTPTPTPTPNPERPSLVVRWASALAGAALLVPAAALFWLPELAVPLALTALGLLARQFRWAADAQAALMVRSAEGRARFVALPLWARYLVSVTAAIVLVALIALLFGR